MTLYLIEPAGPPASEQVLQAISRFLQQRAAASASEVARCLAWGLPAVRAGLEHLVQSGRVEAMRPVGCYQPPLPEEPPPGQPSPEDLVYYRWKKHDDRRHLWQVGLRRPPPPRLRELTGAPFEPG